jgi:hypothetical protein
MIDGYDFGRISVDGKEYRCDVIVFPERVVDSWWRKEGHRLCLDDLQEALAWRPEALVIGQGQPGLMKVPPALIEELRRRGIEVFAAPTEKAVAEYNRLCGSKKTVAALHLTC